MGNITNHKKITTTILDDIGWYWMVLDVMRKLGNGTQENEIQTLETSDSVKEIGNRTSVNLNIRKLGKTKMQKHKDFEKR